MYDFTYHKPTSVADAVKLLASAGADIHEVNHDGWTALHAAAFAGHGTVVQYLIDQGASINQKTKYGRSWPR